MLQGFSHYIKTNSSGAALVDYLILDTDGLSWELKPTYRYGETDPVFSLYNDRKGFQSFFFLDYSQDRHGDGYGAFPGSRNPLPSWLWTQEGLVLLVQS